MKAAFVVACLLLFSAVASADDARIVEARQQFAEGAELVKRAQWAEALAAFERSAALRAHPVTTYNVAACHRALGRYTIARSLFRVALAANEAQGGTLPVALRQDATAFLDEIERVLVRLDVKFDPPDATIAVDGRPLEIVGDSLVAGLASPGAGTTPAASRFTLQLDPGTHLFTLARKGYADVLVHPTFAPGTRSELRLELTRLPAKVNIATDTRDAAVAIDALDVGLAPLSLSRPAGSYDLLVRRRGYNPYKARVTVQPGESVDLHVHLTLEKQPLYKKWWFWTATGAVLTGAALAAYFGTKATETPELDGGGLGWVAHIK